MKKLIFLLILLVPFEILQAQIEGDNIFQTDQIITIELNFSQPGYWDSLVLNYETQTYMQADLVLTDLTGTYTFNDVGVRLKGNSSYSHPNDKKSFKIDFNKYVSGQNYDGLKKLNFSNGFKDPSCMREKIFFDVCRDAGVPAPRANFANVYFNGVLKGFFTVIEQIDDQFLDWAILDDDGNLLKAGDNFGGGGPGGGGGDSEADLNYYGTAQSLYEARYELKTNEDLNDWSDFIDLIDFINNSSDVDFETDLESHLDVYNFIRSAALDNLFSNLDSYTGSARNFYLYHNLTSNQWEWIKWDGNESFGSYGGGGPGGGMDMTTLPVNYLDNNRPLLERIFNNTTLYNQYLKEVCLLNEQFFNPDFLHPKIDGFKTLIQNSVYADNNKMYSNQNFDDNIENNITAGGGPGGGGVTYGLKSFVSSKNTFMNNTLDCSLLTTTQDPFLQPILVSPNPTHCFTKIRWDGTPDFLTVINSLGQVVFQENLTGKTEATLDFSGLDSGFYQLLIHYNTAISTNKIIVF